MAFKECIIQTDSSSYTRVTKMKRIDETKIGSDQDKTEKSDPKFQEKKLTYHKLSDCHLYEYCCKMQRLCNVQKMNRFVANAPKRLR